ncbi:protein SERAC1 [Microdochium nivale]|nr:protein SERAC1 [Microdochium nivale]
MGSINKEISRYEATAVYTHPDAKVDIILVHGLNGDPQRTWTAKTNGVFWPADLLPTTLKDARANVLVYGYNADVYSKKHGSNPSDNFIYLHAQTMVTSLTHFRKDELSSRNPIIWVCHSLGGILTKRALLYSNDLKSPQHEEYRSLYVSTYGMVFLGTPHSGSDVAAWGVIIQAMSDTVIPRSFFHSEPVLLKTLKRDNETLQNINNHFLDIYQRFKIIMAHECHMTDLKATRALIVDPSSAGPQLPGVLYFGIEATHSNMCKFDSIGAPGYRTMMTAIRDWVLAAPTVISTRWRVEDEDRFARAQHEIAERMQSWSNSQQVAATNTLYQHHNGTVTTVAPKDAAVEESHIQTQAGTGDPQDIHQSSQNTVSDSHRSSRTAISVKPAMFRPNTHFKGREVELITLHKMLMDRERRATGTASALIQSMPGGGKSQLARQYVFLHKRHYPGGSFWIRAKSIEELEEGYLDIARTAGLLETHISELQSPDHTMSMVRKVREWLNHTENWLLVLDGVHFDMPNLHLFIPFAKNTSIVYTSTERAIADDYLFDNPKVLALERLSVQDARELLLEEMGKIKPYNSDDISRATELVNLMDRLPLMIHVAGSHLKATREPLANYLRSFRNRPKAGHLQAYLEVRKQLQDRGFTAALNLMCILSFFDQHVPVGMIALGSKGLDRSTPIMTHSTDSGRHSLSNSLQVLISFALIDRNICYESSATGSSSDQSVDMDRESLDVLHIHGIVQAFFVDALADDKEAHFWLEQGIRVFCRAFDEGQRRINENQEVGVPEDLRRFSMHGKRLLGHLGRFEKHFPNLNYWHTALRARLNQVDDMISELKDRVTELHDTAGSSAFMSVFEHHSSLSEDDSDTPTSRREQVDYFNDETEVTLVPDPVTTPADYNPYHWHVSYPGRPAMLYDDDAVTLPDTPTQLPTASFPENPTLPFNDTEPDYQYVDHRTVRKRSIRRYRDHYGAWREVVAAEADPRVTLSREVAKGVLETTGAGPQHAGGDDRSLQTKLESIANGLADLASSLSGDNVGSEAARALHQLSKRRLALSTIDDFSSKLVNRSLVRPALVTGKPSYSRARTATNNEPTPTIPTFSYRLDDYVPPSSSYTAATIMRLQEDHQRGSKEQASPTAASTLPIYNTASSLASPVPFRRQETPEGTMLPSLGQDDPAMNLVQGSNDRGTISSPTQRGSLSRFSLAMPDTNPIEYSQNADQSTLSPAVPVAIRRQRMANSSHDHQFPGASGSNGGPASGIVARSTQPQQMPQIPVPNSPSTIVLPMSRITNDSHRPGPGYMSEPMSRDMSYRSEISHFSDSLLYRQPDYENRLARRGVGLGTYQSSLSASPDPQSMQHPRSRRPSFVETEPSPNLPDFASGSLAENPEYRSPKHSPTSMGMVDSGASRTSTTSTRTVSLPYPDEQKLPRTGSGRFLARFRDAGAPRAVETGHDAQRAAGQRRAASATGRLSGLKRGRPGWYQKSPQGDKPSRQSLEIDPDRLLSRTAPRPTSTSPGVRLQDGSFIEFGGGFAQENQASPPRSFRRSSWRLRRGRQLQPQEAVREAEVGTPAIGLGIDEVGGISR